jgi:hypothetical protein
MAGKQKCDIFFLSPFLPFDQNPVRISGAASSSHLNDKPRHHGTIVRGETSGTCQAEIITNLAIELAELRTFSLIKSEKSSLSSKSRLLNMAGLGS